MFDGLEFENELRIHPKHNGSMFVDESEPLIAGPDFDPFDQG